MKKIKGKICKIALHVCYIILAALNQKGSRVGGGGLLRQKGGGQLLYFWEVGASISTYFEQNCSSFGYIHTLAWQL